MKEELGGFIGELLNKLDKSIIILLLPMLVAIYIGFFIPDKELERFFSIEIPIREEIKCPVCGNVLILEYKDNKYILTPK